MKAKILLLLLKNACKFNSDKTIYVSVDNKLIPCTRIVSNKDKIVIVCHCKERLVSKG